MRKAKKPARPTNIRKRDQFLSIGGFACTIAAWGWTVLAPQANIFFGSVLLVGGFILFAFAVCQSLNLRLLFTLSICLVFGAGGYLFDYEVVIKRQRGIPLRNLLIEGYHISSECSIRPYHEETPSWMRDAQERWQAAVQQFIEGNLDASDLQIWNRAVVLGLVRDKDSNGYRCTQTAAKIAALETIVSQKYDPKLQHSNYTGPVYVFESHPEDMVTIKGKIAPSTAP